MVSKDPEMQKSRQNAHFFLAVLAATQEGVHSFRYPDKRNGNLYSTLKNIEDYALKPFNNIEDHFTVLWNNAPSTLKGEIVEYTAKMAKLVQIGGLELLHLSEIFQNPWAESKTHGAIDFSCQSQQYHPSIGWTISRGCCCFLHYIRVSFLNSDIAVISLIKYIELRAIFIERSVFNPTCR